jgi:hypothetical protein
MHAERLANSLFRHPRKSLAGIHPRETSSGLTPHLSPCPLSKNPPSSPFVKGGTSLRSATDAFQLTPDAPLTASHKGFPIYVILRETKDLAEP